LGLPDGEEIMTSFRRFDNTGAWRTDRRTDGQTDTLLCLLPALA